ncbi:MAG TPA: PIG-L deacetylase family protein [Acidimicrobiales bacterium]|nr:PIG-L deacetylase family protein [Acidimicrobiales bacterium]
MAVLVDDVPTRVLAVYAHPDDPEVSSAGTLARWVKAGAEVHLVICARGDKGSIDPAVVPAELAQRRAGEVAAAASCLGLAGHRLLGMADGEIENTLAFREQLVRIVREVRPDVVVCHDPTAVFFGSRYYNHRDHREVGWTMLDALAPAAAGPHYFPDAGAPHQVRTVFLSGSLQPDAWVDITDTVEVKAEALLCHKSQLHEAAEQVREVVRRRAEESGRQAGVAYAEAYRLLRLSD